MSKTTRFAPILANLTIIAVIAASAAGEMARPSPAQGAASAPVDNRPVAVPGSLQFGVYDPHADFSSDASVKIEHLFMPWQDVDLATLAAADVYARERGRSLLITVEPWSWSENKRIKSDALLRGILAGHYDGNISAICGAANKLQAPTTIRWAQEMEDTTGRFSWAGWAPADYKATYRKFVDECRTVAHNVKFMWSPMGMPTLDKYYPGDDVVDSVGLTVFGLQKFDRDNFGRDRTFAEILKPGYDIASRFDKPIYVAELGYVGNRDYVRNWASSVLQRYPQFSKLAGIVYFDDKEISPWPGNYGLPNWRVTSNVVN
jgi:beta-mannanase